MILNWVERAAMNNPVRAAFQRYLETPRMLSLGGAMSGGRALEVGCGRGQGVELVLRFLGAEEVEAFDLDPRMISLAKRRLGGYGERVRLWEGDVTRIPAEDGRYDAVFDFGIIHHVPQWREALKEIFRVLKPGGRFYCEEVLARFILNPLWRALLDHPLEDRFDSDAFIAGLSECGFSLIAFKPLFSWFGWFVADKPAG
jgi:ubiquinone/menaquinone biosynthesis C-methylase UbiE